jgi:gamma-glutamyltranspeptidase
LTWERLFQPSIELSKGFKVEKLLSMRIDQLKEFYEKYPDITKELHQQFNPSLKEFDTIKREKLTETLIKISKEGITPFYNGELTKVMVDDIKSQGGILEESDFNNYNVKVRPVLSTFYHGLKIITW